MRKARVEHLDSFDVATAAKNTVLHDGKLTWSAVWKSNLCSRITQSTQVDRLRHRAVVRLPADEGARRPARTPRTKVLCRPAHGAPRRGLHREHGRGGAGRGGAGALEPPRDLITHTNIRQPPRRPAPSTTPRPSPRARRAPPVSGPGTTLIQRGPRAPIGRRASSLDAAATRKASANAVK